MRAPRHSEIWEGFRHLDADAIAHAAVASAEPDDAARVALAFAAVARGEHDDARALLGSLEEDGSASRGDLAYVRGFLAAHEERYDTAALILESAFDDEGAVHRGGLRLRAAEARIALEQFEAAVTDLAPLLDPPGGDDTLEAHFLLLDILVRSKSAKERLVEQIALIDALVERGFFLRTALAVVHAGHVLADGRIAGVQERLYAAHTILLESYITDDRDEIAWLVSEGERHKSAGLVAASARSYTRVPFPWEAGSPEAVALQFAQHEEFEAACALFEHTFAVDELHERGDLWGPYLLCCFHSERWQQTLDLIARHWSEIEPSPLREQTLAIRAESERALGAPSSSSASKAEQDDPIQPPAAPRTGWRSRGYLPHLDVPNGLQSLTFRLADSLPIEAIARIEREIADQPAEIRDSELRRRLDNFMDSGAGSCVLAKPEAAKVVEDALLHFDGDRYRVFAWVVMPNHVHALIQLLGGWNLENILQSWKSFTGRWINQHRAELDLGNDDSGVWQREYWDRRIRDQRHFDNVVSYIHNNPVNARLVVRAEDWEWSSARRLR